MRSIFRAISAAGIIAGAGFAPAAAQESQRPQPRPAHLAEVAAALASAAEATGTGATEASASTAPQETPALAAPKAAPQPEAAAQARPAEPPRDPNRGSVTNLPLPRYVSLKGNEGNARRGPGLTHRIDWVFTRAGMPLRITAEHEHWRRIEDAEGAGGWVHYALLSGVRSVIVAADIADFHNRPDDTSAIDFRAERNVVGWVQECRPDWCRISVNGERGWVRKSDLWGVEAGEIIE
jgi:SH3-like domain-containing protein